MNRLKTVSAYSSKLSNVVHNNVVKKQCMINSYKSKWY